MGMGTTITSLCKNTLFFKIALLCLVLYSLRSDVVVKCDDGAVGGGAVRSSEYARMVGRRRNGWSSSPMWRRRKVVHRRHSSTPSTSTEASVELSSSSLSPDPNIRPLLPDDFINLASNSAGIGPSSESGAVLPSSSFFPTSQSQKIFADPFMLVGEDNILGPTPTAPRRKIYRRTRRRRIKKLRGEATGGDGSSSTQEPSSSSAAVTEEEVVTGEEFGSTTSASTESLNKYKYLTTKGSSRRSTEKPTLRSSSSTTTMKLAVVPIDSLMQGQTEEVSTETSSLLTTGPTATSLTGTNNNIKPGFYTGHQKGGKGGGGGRKRAKSKENLWIAPVVERAPNFSVELFDNTDATDELNNSNLDKRESTKSNSSPVKNFNMFALKPTSLTSLLNEGDMSTGESISNPYVNTTLPISTELQNSLQFTLQSLHPLLNSDSVLTQNTPKIPENKTVAITHFLAEGSGDTPIAPDLRFLPTHLRKSHPLLSEETFLNGGFGGGIGSSGSKVGPRLNVYPGLHSMRNNDEQSSSTSTTEKNKGQFSSTFKSVVSIPSTLRTATRVGGTFTTSTSTTTTSTTTTSTQPSSTTARKTTSTSTNSPKTPTGKVTPTPASGNVHLESLGNLKITEIVYPTKTVPPPPPPPPPKSSADFKNYAAPPERPSSTTTSASTTKKSSTTTTTLATTTRQSTTKASAAPPVAPSGRPTPYFDDKHSPPLILMGSDSTMGSAIESPPAFDDLLLEELIKGFEPPKPPSTTTTTTTTPRPTTTTSKPTTTKTTPKPTTTTRRTTTTTTTTTTTPPPPTQPPKLSPQQQKQEDEAQQLIQLLNLLQANQLPLSTTTEGLKSSSTSTTLSTTSTSSSTLNPAKLDDDFLKNLALLENLLSPTAKTMIKEAVDAGTTEKIKSTSPSANGEQGLSNADLHKIFAMLDAMSSTTPRPTPTTTTTPKPAQVMHPALQNMLNMLTNPMQSVQKPVFSIPEPPKPVPTTSSFDLLSQLFNLNGAQATPKVIQQPQAPPQPTFSSGLGALGGLFESFLPKKQPSNREAAASASNPLLSFFQPPSEPVVTPAPGPYYWFDVNAFLGQDPNAGPMSGIRPKFGTRDYFLKVRKRRNSVEVY